MNKPINRPGRSYANAASQDQADQREIWHKLVVKIISWKDGLLEGGIIKITDKISSKEWNVYFKRILKMNTSYSKERVLLSLKETKDLITKNGGFEEDIYNSKNQKTL